jgi:hypothetical protein
LGVLLELRVKSTTPTSWGSKVEAITGIALMQCYYRACSNAPGVEGQSEWEGHEH